MQEDTSLFGATMEKTHAWLKELVEIGHFKNQEKAYSALRAVLQTLRSQLNIDEVAKVGAQLPMLIRGFYYEGWDPAHKVKPIKETGEFYHHIRAHLGNKDGDIDPERATKAVFHLLTQKFSHGEVDKILGVMPKSIKELLSSLEHG